jgi:hypothetical protein
LGGAGVFEKKEALKDFATRFLVFKKFLHSPPPLFGGFVFEDIKFCCSYPQAHPFSLFKEC